MKIIKNTGSPYPFYKYYLVYIKIKFNNFSFFMKYLIIFLKKGVLIII